MTSGPQDGDPVVVGRVGKPFGIGGQVYVHADHDLDEPLRPGGRYGSDRGPDLTVATIREHAARLLVLFEGVSDRSGAEALRGTVLTLPRAAIGLAEGAQWVDALLGRQVVDADGETVGVVAAVLDGAAHDFLSVKRPDDSELLVPLVGAIVDTDAEPIRLHPLPGLLELGET